MHMKKNVLTPLPSASPPQSACGRSLPGAAPDAAKQGIFSGRQGKNHVQGIAVDEANGFVYYSFTTRLVKTDLQGKLIGSVEGLVGHLGCIALNPENGLVYGSLEFKKDKIGAGILKSLGREEKYEDGFYIAVFSPEKIVREHMSAEADGVMRAVFLPEVLADHTGEGVNLKGETVSHRYGCSGVDGLCFAPRPGETDGQKYCWLAYGVYSDLSRGDNDHQVLLCFDAADIAACARPLSQTEMHRHAPALPPEKYFVLTGNTEYGVQNLEYDEARRMLLMAVYAGHKPEFPNYDIYAADLSKPAVQTELTGLHETGAALTLWNASAPERADEIAGWRFSCGQYGMQFISGGALCCAQPVTVDGENAAYVYAYSFDPRKGFERLFLETR